MDYQTLTDVALPLLLKGYEFASGKIAESALTKAGEQLFSYVQEKLTSPGESEALTKFTKKPDDDLVRRNLLNQLEMALRDDPVFKEKFEAMISNPVAQQIRQTQKIGDVGSNNKIIQANDGSTANIY